MPVVTCRIGNHLEAQQERQGGPTVGSIMVPTLLGELYVSFWRKKCNRNFFACIVRNDYQHYEQHKTLFGKHVYCTIDRTLQNFLDVRIYCNTAILDFVVFFVAWIF
jgi:hypothetical protein